MVEEWSKQKKMPKLVEVIFSKILNEERLWKRRFFLRNIGDIECLKKT
jgi:hypothetical protein